MTSILNPWYCYKWMIWMILCTKCICIFGPPNMGKAEAASSLNSYMNGVRQSTTSTKFYKWTRECNNTNLFSLHKRQLYHWRNMHKKFKPLLVLGHYWSPEFLCDQEFFCLLCFFWAQALAAKDNNVPLGTPRESRIFFASLLKKSNLWSRGYVSLCQWPTLNFFGGELQ